jgi:hypothetical protein
MRSLLGGFGWYDLRWVGAKFGMVMEDRCTIRWKADARLGLYQEKRRAGYVTCH